VPIMVILVDNETPRMAINSGLELEIGKFKVISSQDLKATTSIQRTRASFMLSIWCLCRVSYSI